MTCRADKDYSRIPVGEGVECTRDVQCFGNFAFTHRVLAIYISLVAIFSAVIPRMYPDPLSDDAARVCCENKTKIDSLKKYAVPGIAHGSGVQTVDLLICMHTSIGWNASQSVCSGAILLPPVYFNPGASRCHGDWHRSDIALKDTDSC